MKILRIPLVVVLVVLAGRAFNANALTKMNLYSFGNSPTDGQLPWAGLVQGSDSNFYGTTYAGGSNTFCIGCGTVFRISPSGTHTNLYSFGNSPADGEAPRAGLVQGSDGNFYGTTYSGGSSDEGTVFRISPSGTYTSLYSFGSSVTDGNDALGLVQGSDSNFYGTTYAGGSNTFCIGCGTVFRISPSGTYTSLYSFGSSPTDGQLPFAGLVEGSDGNFYGTTELGGTHNTGTVFRISPSGSETNLHSFGSTPTDGEAPGAGLVLGSDGNFYGTTELGGIHHTGTVFRISPSGTYTSLYSFVGYPTDGANPFAGLVQGSDGNFYGTTTGGGTGMSDPYCIGCGTVFRISPSGSETALYSFVGYPTDGYEPVAGLVQGSDGNFYGTTYFGGTNCPGCGTVFKLTVPLSPPPFPINQITGVDIAGTNIIFIIPSIAGEMYQLQFSSSMSPTNWVNDGPSVTSIGGSLMLTNYGGAVAPQRYYRFVITP